VRIEAFDPATAPDRDLQGWYDVRVACDRLDLPDDPVPPLAAVIAGLRALRPQGRQYCWVARGDDGAIVGFALLTLDDAGSNTHSGDVELAVHPAQRRRGAGRQLLEQVVAAMRADGRRALLSEVIEGSDGERFAAPMGATLELRERRSILTLADLDAGLLDLVLSRPPAGYRLVRWVGRAPEHLLGAFAVAKAAINDAPMGGLDWNPDTFDASRIRAQEIREDSKQRDLLVLAAVVEAGSDDGAPEVAGLTEISLSRLDRRRAEQGDTSVVPAHRGHGIGLWLKAAMLRWLLEDYPGVVDIATWNAETNRHMLAINERLGFRREHTYCEWQLLIPLGDKREREPAGAVRTPSA